VLSLVLFVGFAQAAEPTQADFDACNRQAAAKVSSPSASPRMDAPPTATAPTPPGAAGTPAAKPPTAADPLKGIASGKVGDLGYQDFTP
jgi:hypothetical protein